MRVDPRTFPALSQLDPDNSPLSRAPVNTEDQLLVGEPGVILDNAGLEDASMAMEWEGGASPKDQKPVSQPGSSKSHAANGGPQFPGADKTPSSSPLRKRVQPPTSIPNFPPSSSTSSSSSAQVATSKSQQTSPRSSHSFQIPATPPSKPPQSPWHQLALASGAPTPSLESGPGRAANRHSPALGYPFEKLNIGGSWSGANLFGAGQGQPDEGFGFPPTGAAAPHAMSASPAPLPSPSMTSTSGTSGMSAQTIARYRALAGKTSTPASTTGPPIPSGSSTSAMAPPPLPKAPGGFQLNFPGSSLANRRSTVPKTDTKGQEQTQQNYPSAKSPPRVSFPSPGLPAGPSAGSSNRLQPLAPGSVKELLGKSTTLVLDLRPPSSFTPCHIPNSHSLPIPSTLLRRQTFSLQKLAQMLPQPALASITHYREMTDIIVIDQESHSAPEGSVLRGLSSKFEREDYKGRLWFVKGGMAALLHRGEIEMELGEDKAGGEHETENETENVAPLGSPGALNPSRLMAGKLGKLAFQQGSTGGGRNVSTTPGARSLTLPTPNRAFNASSEQPHASTSNGSAAPTERPLFTSRRDVDMSSRSSPLPDPTQSRARQLQPANPFFDNIRQNLELSHGGITERIPLALPDDIVKRAKDLPHWLRDLVEAPEDVSMQKLAMQFYSIELGEQKRLQGVMDWHTNGSGGVMDSNYDGQGLEGISSAKRGILNERFKQEMELKRLTPKGSTGEQKEEGYFPFSITAGVERGTKNRYKNIWPYDFSRVRLASPADDDSDYINASFVQPRTTSRRYIATQGPLDSTYRDFWTLIWEQQVTVIVMLTKQYEGGLLKCGDYWSEGTYGALKLEQVSVSGVEEEKPDASTSTGFDFGFVQPKSESTVNEGGNIKRTFLLRHMDQPSQKPRKVVQIQCVAWPDFDVPESPECLLRLIRDVDETVDEIHGTGSRSDQSRANLPPVLVHCSAGVGRTGSFIVVDAIIDALRRERHTAEKEKRSVRSIRTRSSSKLLVKSPRAKAGSESSSNASGTSFLNPFSAEAPASALVTSPGALSSPAAVSIEENPKPESMDVDHQGAIAIPDASPASTIGSQFTEFREGRRDSVDSTGHGFATESKRPSFFSTNSHDSGLTAGTAGSLPIDSEHLKGSLPLSSSHGAAQAPSPISDLEDPVQTVLEGMRVQRMSLCQSLRQYLFVYRVIIYYYLHLLDQEAAEHEANITSDSEHPNGTLSSIMSLSNTGSSAVSTDDESHAKRRASPTELQPSGSSLSKRPSFKKMRPAGGVNVLSPGEAGTPGGSPGRHRRKPSSQD